MGGAEGQRARGSHCQRDGWRDAKKTGFQAEGLKHDG